MIPVAQALAHILATARLRPATAVPLAEATGQILREPLTADRDFPPGNRVTMDGIIIRYADWKKGIRSFPVQEMQVAGTEPVTLLQPGTCIEIMTGAMHSSSADTVIRYEDLHIDVQNGQRIAQVMTETVRPRQNVHFQGTDATQGDLLMEPGRRIGPPEIGIAASIGKTHLLVSAPPRIAIISTGDELVDVSAAPLPYQIRRSNSYSLQAALREMHVPHTDCYHLADQKPLLMRELKQLLQDYDTLILSGGVSMGKADFVPSVLEELGVQCIFHKVAQRPGKPLWFGTMGEKTVFGLPGNPVSTFVSFYAYLRPWLLRCLGQTAAPSPVAVLTTDVQFLPPLTYYMQVKVSMDAQGRLLATPQQGHGSGDHGNLMHCDGFLQLPPDQTQFAAGEVFPLLPYR